MSSSCKKRYSKCPDKFAFDFYLYELPCYLLDVVLYPCRAVTESINQLITACSVSSAPGQKECDAAVRQLQVAT